MTETVAYLLDRGAQIDKEDSYGQTALARAAAVGREATVKLLLARGAAADQRDKCGHTPLSRAVWLGLTGVGGILLERRVLIDTQDNEGKTPLTWADQNGQAAMVTLLLGAGADDTIGDYVKANSSFVGHAA
jgi:ankyrin repeat protein